MSGHSKWATTKRQKAVVDARRAKIFTKINNNISVAARQGADPTANSKLRLAVEQARAMHMPKENIDRAIARGAGLTGNGSQLESITYEAFAPGGVAIIVEVVTNNKNRAAATIKHIFSKSGGGLSSGGSAAWQFEHRGVIYWPAEVMEKMSYNLTPDQELGLIEGGVIDIKNQNNQIVIYTTAEDLDRVCNLMKRLGLADFQAGLEWVPKNLVKPADEEKLVKLLQELEDEDGVNNVYTNADI